MRVKIPRFYLISILLVTLLTAHSCLSQGSPMDDDDDVWKHYDDESHSLLQNSNESLEDSVSLVQTQKEVTAESPDPLPSPSPSTNTYSKEPTTPTELTTPTTTQNITIGTSSTTSPASEGITEPSQQTTVPSEQTSPGNANDTSSTSSEGETSTVDVSTMTTISGAETTKTDDSSSTPINSTDGTETTKPTSMIRTSTVSFLTTTLPPLIYIEQGGVSTWAVVVISICLSFVGIFTGLYFLRGYLINRRRADQKRLLRSSISSEGFFYGDVAETTAADSNGDRFHENF